MNLKKPQTLWKIYNWEQKFKRALVREVRLLLGPPVLPQPLVLLGPPVLLGLQDLLDRSLVQALLQLLLPSVNKHFLLHFSISTAMIVLLHKLQLEAHLHLPHLQLHHLINKPQEVPLHLLQLLHLLLLHQLHHLLHQQNHQAPLLQVQIHQILQDQIELFVKKNNKRSLIVILIQA